MFNFFKKTIEPTITNEIDLTELEAMAREIILEAINNIN